MRHASLFNGIGGFQLAAEMMGWENVMSCEINDWCNNVTKKHYPNCIQHGDINKTDFTIYKGLLDIITGGDPCQVSSKIGKQEGMGGALYMWPEHLRAVRESEVATVVNENVDGTISNGILDRKIADLESIGYSCWPPIVIPASFVGGWHQRARVFLVANSIERRLERRGYRTEERQREIKIGPITALVENKNGVIVPKSEFLSGNDGIPKWVDEIKAYGNAVMPLVAYEILKLVEAYNSTI